MQEGIDWRRTDLTDEEGDPIVEVRAKCQRCGAILGWFAQGRHFSSPPRYCNSCCPQQPLRPGPSQWEGFRDGFRRAPVVVKVLVIIGLLVVLMPVLGCLILPVVALLGK